MRVVVLMAGLGLCGCSGEDTKDRTVVLTDSGGTLVPTTTPPTTPTTTPTTTLTTSTTAPGYEADWSLNRLSASTKHSCALNEGGTIECWGTSDVGEADPPGGMQLIDMSTNTLVGCGVRYADSVISCWGDDTYGHGSPPKLTYWKQVSVGARHTCARDLEDRLDCWGSNGLSDLLAAPEGEYTSVSVGLDYACAVKDDGRIPCWGDNSGGRAESQSGRTFVQVSTNYYHSCAIGLGGSPDTMDTGLAEGPPMGSVLCWGDDTYGRATPPPGDDFVQVSAGGMHSCGLRADGSVVCWGSNTYKELEVPKGVAFQQIAAGYNHTCGLSEGHDVTCWGSDFYGQSSPLP